MTLSVQFVTMLTMISMGTLFGAALDTYNRFLQRRKRKTWLVFINDIMFWLLQGLFIFYILFQVNQGDLRFYIFIALFCGFALYQSMLKGIYLKWLEKFISFVIKVFHFLVKLLTVLIYRPIYLLITTLWAIAIAIGNGAIVIGKWLLKCLWVIIIICTRPFKWILLLIWRFVPKHIKKTVEKLYNRLEGKTVILKNYFISWIRKWKKTK